MRSDANDLAVRCPAARVWNEDASSGRVKMSNARLVVTAGHRCGAVVRMTRIATGVALALTLATTSPVFGQTLQPTRIQPVAPATPADPPPPPGTTAEPGDNQFNLRDGSTVRGRVVELHPGQFVIVALRDSVPRTLAWTDILHAEGPSFPGGYTATLYAPAMGGGATIEREDYLHPGGDRVPLVIESPEVVQEISETYTTGVGQGWGGASRPMGRALCITPCTLYVPPSRFMITSRGRGLRTYSSQIEVPPGGVRVRLYAPSAGRFYASLGLIGGGAMFMLSGGAIALVGAMSSSFATYGSFSTVSSIGAAYEIAGGVMAAAGAAALTAGLVVLATGHNGVASRRPVGAVTPQVSLAPTAGGMAAVLTLRF